MRLKHERRLGSVMDALVTVCPWTTDVTGDRTHLEHERVYGLGMDAPVTVCSWNTNVIMV